MLSAVLGLMTAAACAPMPDGARPTFPFAPGWSSASAKLAQGAPRLIDNARWWQGLQDPVLDGLVARALTGNPDLAAARARAQAAARATAGVPGALGLSGGVSAQGLGGSGATSDGQASADLGLELLFDPGRGREANRRAAAAAAGEAAAAAAGARLFLIGEMADAYLSLRHGQRRLALAQADAGRQRQTLELARSLSAGGEGTRIETLRSEARLASLQAEMPGLEAAVAKDLARLAILAGDAPGALPPDLMAALKQTRPQPRAKLAPDPGIPADLLRNRPDIHAAEARYDAARAALGQARAALYPRLSLSGTIEAEQRVLGGASAGGNGVVAIGPNLRLPALPQAPARAGVEAAVARVEAAHADWTSAVLKALYEVEAALLDYRAAARAETAADRAVTLHGQARKLMRDATAAGEATLSDLIAVEDALAAAEAAQANARRNRAGSFVLLNIRLGAGSGMAEIRPLP